MVARAACHVNNGSAARTDIVEDTRNASKSELNQADIYGVAIDTATSTVIYWAEAG